jgi:predicted nucleic acid-binding Zn ribbon protein
MFRPPGDCPVCSEFVPQGRKSCLACGADERSGWRDDQEDEAGYNPDVPDEEFNYDAFVKDEFGDDSPKPRNLRLVWWIAGILLLLALLIGTFAGVCPVP